ncbi:MAG: hypothetical protein V4563_14230 [Pseudomonadota bacterium]
METDPKRLVAGTINLAGGIDSGRAPNTLAVNQAAFAVNTTMRGGFANSRPPLTKKPATIPQGRFQHAAFFDGTGTPMIMLVVDGHFYRINPETYEVQEFTGNRHASVFTVNDFVTPAIASTVNVNVGVTENFNLKYPVLIIGLFEYTLTAIVSDTVITVRNDFHSAGDTIPRGTAVNFIADDENPASDTMGWSVQAENYWIYQNNRSLPVIFDGASMRRADIRRSEIPVGNVIEYGMGRLTVALPDRKSFRMGDLVGGPSGTLTFGFIDSILRFTENNIVTEGGDFVARIFGAPSRSGPIRAIRYTANLDTSLGQGPMMVFTTNTVFSIQAPFDRTTWATLNSPIQTVSAVEYGASAQESTILFNSDVYYRSPDGIRSLILARRYFTTPGNTPISTEVSRVLDKDDGWLLEYGSAVVFDNRLLMTVSPVMTDYGVYHRGLVVFDAHLLSSMGAKSPPVWEGIWSGLNVLKILKGSVNGIEHCWIFALNADNELELWELLPSKAGGVGDFNGETTLRVARAMELRSEDFGSAMDLKRLDGGVLFLDQVEGNVDVTLQYREDAQNCWRDWYSFRVCAVNETCNPDGCAIPANLQPQTKSKIRIPTPPEEDDLPNKKLTRVGYEFQPRITITGKARFRGLRLNAMPEEEIAGFEESQAIPSNNGNGRWTADSTTITADDTSHTADE